MPPRLAVSPLSWTNDVLHELGGDTPVETCLDQAAAAGFAGVELGRLFPRDAAVLGPMLAERGLSLASGWHSGRLAEDGVTAERAAVKDHAALLSALGSTVMVYGETAMMAGDRPLDLPLSRRLRMPADDLPAYARRLTEFGDWLAGEYGLRLAYHHHLMMVAETLPEISALLSHGPSIALLLDTGHAAAAGFPYARLIDAFGDRIAHIHLKDVRTARLAVLRAGDASFNDGVRRGLFAVPGDGDLDFAPVLRFAAGGDFDGWMVVEAEADPAVVPPFPAVSRGYAHLRQMMNSLERTAG